MDYSHYERIKIDRRGHILTLTLNRPETRNAIDGRMHNELATIFYDVQLDEQADVIVITGAGSAFSAGGDINWLASLRPASSAGHLGSVDVKKIVWIARLRKANYRSHPRPMSRAWCNHRAVVRRDLRR